MILKKEVEEKDSVATGMFSDIDLLQRRHQLMISDLNAHLARYSEINKEQKATLNRELEFPEHALLSITSAARAYKDSSEAFELVLSHLVEFYRDYVDNMEVSTDINKVSERYGEKIEKLTNEIHKAATLRGIHIQRIEILTSQVAQYEAELDTMQKQMTDSKKKGITIIPDATSQMPEAQNTSLSNGPNSITLKDPKNGSTQILPIADSKTIAGVTNPSKQEDHNIKRKIGRPRKSEYDKDITKEMPNDNTSSN